MLTKFSPLLGLAACIALGTACERKSSDTSKSGGAQQPGAQGDEVVLESRAPAHSPPPPPGPRPPAQPLGPERAGAHILIAYKGSASAKPDVTRTKDEALALAKQLVAEARKAPASFGELAKRHSACPSAQRSGLLGVWPRGRMVPEFDTAIDGLKVGEISEPVETRFGFHVIKRLETRYAGRHILVAYKGSQRAKETVTRTKDEALALAKQLSAEVKKNPAAFPELAKKHSDDPTAAGSGGSLGAWQPGRMVAEFQTAVEGMQIGAISDPVESPFGFHVIKREDPASMPK